MFFKKDLVLSQEYLAFLLLNLFDLFLTGWFFKHHALEANGLAQWILTQFGLRGFALFKFLMVIFIILICEVIAFASVRKARIVIISGCIVYLLLIFYESFLVVTQAPVFGGPPPPAHRPHGRRNDDSLLPVRRAGRSIALTVTGRLSLRMRDVA